jgi:hypothetical protein
MKKGYLTSRRFLFQTSAVILSMMLFSLGLVITGEGASTIRVDSVEMFGLTGSTNNMAFVFERYAIVAPYAPKSAVNEDSTLEDFDNHFLYLIDTKRPDLGIQKVDIKCYYPTKLIYDPDTRVAFIRGTRYEQVEDKYEPVEVISHVLINLDDNGKPVFGNAITFDVRGVDSERTNNALPDLGLGRRGNVLVFSNGASAYTFTLTEGYIRDINFRSVFNPDDSISFMGVDEATNTLVVSVTQREKREDGEIKESSELWFYELQLDGTVTLITRVLPPGFPEGTAIAAGSNVVIVSGTPAEGAAFATPLSAYLVTNDGSICTVDLTTPTFDGSVKRIETVPALAQGDPENASARILSYDAQKKVLTVLKRGNISQIRRPLYGRPRATGSIRRPLYARVQESPALVFAQFGKRSDKLREMKVFEAEFSAGDALSTLTLGQGSAPAFATYSGHLYSVNLSESVSKASLVSLGQIGDRVDYLAFNSQRNSYVSINSFRVNEDGTEIAEPGALSVAKFASLGTLPGLFQGMSLFGSLTKNAVPSIRRPVNIGRPTR